MYAIYYFSPICTQRGSAKLSDQLGDNIYNHFYYMKM